MLTIRRTRVLRGPNIWAPEPVIVLEVTIGELEERLQRETPVFFARLVALLPSLEAHRATVGQLELGFARLLLAPIALALQQQAGAAVHVAQTHPTDGPGRYRVIYEYAHAEVGTAAGTLAVRLLNQLLAGSEPGFAFTRELDQHIIQPTARQTHGPFLEPIVAAAKRRGIPVLELSSSPPLLQLGTGAYQRHLAGAVPAETGTAATPSARTTTRTRHLLHGARLPVPDGRVVRDGE